MSAPRSLRLFLAGDVMLGRGVDQIRPRPVDPRIDEEWVRDARKYVELAEERNGPIPRSIGAEYVWGDALGELARADVRIVNLETSITRRGTPWPAKVVHYRMSPEHVDALVAARIDVCSLANNHVLDFGYDGLADTLEALASARIATVGAGHDLETAQRPAIVGLGGGARLFVVGMGLADSGIPYSWLALEDGPGVALLADGEASLANVTAQARALDRDGDLLVASIHFGGNWGYDVPERHRRIAHALIDAGVDVVHGHSSHHPRPIEVYRDRLVLYGCGDFVDDYEGIHGPENERFRGDLVLAYFPELDRASGKLLALAMRPLQIRKMRLTHPSAADVAWLARRSNEACATFGTRVVPSADGRLELRWR